MKNGHVGCRKRRRQKLPKVEHLSTKIVYIQAEDLVFRGHDICIHILYYAPISNQLICLHNNLYAARNEKYANKVIDRYSPCVMYRKRISPNCKMYASSTWIWKDQELVLRIVKRRGDAVASFVSAG